MAAALFAGVYAWRTAPSLLLRRRRYFSYAFNVGSAAENLVEAMVASALLPLLPADVRSKVRRRHTLARTRSSDWSLLRDPEGLATASAAQGGRDGVCARWRARVCV